MAGEREYYYKVMNGLIDEVNKKFKGVYENEDYMVEVLNNHRRALENLNKRLDALEGKMTKDETDVKKMMTLIVDELKEIKEMCDYFSIKEAVAGELFASIEDAMKSLEKRHEQLEKELDVRLQALESK